MVPRKLLRGEDEGAEEEFIGDGSNTDLHPATKKEK